MKNLKKKNLKVAVAMSGGVDSSVAAALLKRAGFNVVGIFMKFWHEREGEENRCCSSESENKARAVAAKLGMPFYVFNLKKEFKKRIVGQFLKEHRAGRTPNPCVVCNREIKFGFLLEKVSVLNADYLATGHYAKVKNDKLFEAKDKNKDQSYFLWGIGLKQLKRVIFPIGNYSKNETRNLAKKFKLPTASSLESQEICFVQGKVNDFLAKYIKPKPGPIVISGKVKIKGLKHRGLHFYTIGQRRGIKLSGGPYWVLRKDLKKNALIITKKEKELFSKELIFNGANWISGKPPKFPLKVKVKIRYGGKPASASLFPGRVVFDRPQKAVTPGQSVVFYRQGQLIGGAFIFRSKSSKI